jgi:uncharacterized membrane protein
MRNKKNWNRILAGMAVAGAAGAVLAFKRSRYPGVKLKAGIIIDRPAEELYRYWRDFRNLPSFVDILESVEILSDGCSRWTVSGPVGVQTTWDARITVDRANEMIGWKSLEGSTVDNLGYVRFERAPGGRGTLVRVALQYVPPAGKLGAVLASVVGKRPGAHVEEALRRFKQLMEAGEIATAQKTSIAKPAEVRRLDTPIPEEDVQTASEDSFPASDPPAWTGTGL